MRKVLGGGWRKPGALAAAALVAMEDAMQRLKKDHEHAKYFAHGKNQIYSLEQIINIHSLARPFGISCWTLECSKYGGDVFIFSFYYFEFQRELYR